MANAVVTILNLYLFVLIARALMSWVPIGHDSPLRTLAEFLYAITEPVLSPVRRVIPPLGGFDLSFIVVFFGIRILTAALS